MASQWAAKRKLLYALVVVIFIILIVGIPLYLFFHKTPTCFDGTKNGNEKGVDCGGKCIKVCSSDISLPIVMWQRAFKVSDGIYNAVAYVQNPNVLNRVDNVEYIFRLYDNENAVITEKKGRTFLSANKTTAIFEPGLRTGTRLPVRTTFEFTESLFWQQNDLNYKEPAVVVENIILSGSTTPRIDASVINNSLKNIKKIAAIAIVYDISDKAIAASRTVIENLIAQSKSNVTFTWPTPFANQAVRKEVLLRVYPEN